MTYKLEIMLRSFRRWLRLCFSRTQWLLRLFGFSKAAGKSSEPGLIMIQIDGLSHGQFKAALKNNKMPFLASLLEREDYHTHDLYSGLPASTPAVQAEIFYGIKTAVPGFSFISKKTGKIVRMYDAEPVQIIEDELQQQAKGLLADGSSYSNIYQGGAKEANFCPTSRGWSVLFRSSNLFSLIVFVLFNMYAFMRTILLVLFELLLAIIDFFRGIISGHDLMRELIFVPMRVGGCILLRELIVIGVKLDIERGLPIIHLNLLAYDEQSHRRGPASKFAHWSLKGIDDAIKRLWTSAKHTTSRDYDIWIYSDHGQEGTVPYIITHGVSVSEAIKNVYSDFIGNGADGNDELLAQPKKNRHKKKKLPFGIQGHRAKILGAGRFIDWLTPSYDPQTEGETKTGSNSHDIKITAMGSLGFVYLDKSLAKDQRDIFAKQLVDQANIPLVLVKLGPNAVKFWTEDGEYTLPEDSKRLFGEERLFLEELSTDMIRLCQHRDVGDLVISGWQKDKPYCTFAMENGSHAGPGPIETHAFAFLPGDTVLPENSSQPPSRTNAHYLRPLDLHRSALHKLGRKNIVTERTVVKNFRDKKSQNIRVMTYNVHHCMGMDGELSFRRIARVIAQYQPDIVALQEVDLRRSRSGFVDQAQAISQCLEMEFHFHPAFYVEEGAYGIAILSHLPLSIIKASNFPQLPHKKMMEPRGALWVSIEAGGRCVQVINTHLGLNSSERQHHAQILFGKDWLQKCINDPSIILCGDFNSFPQSAVCKNIRQILKDVQLTTRQ
ncbi:MAG: endonuclease/exonuclease/phosphatase family metal-dependent hydrolase [Arenicella sp.]|jgi:endonuclease/exonuclease/phosphatase family metal-dependent hydrolase